MSNPLKILSTLNSHLREERELCVFGRGGLAVGFKEAPHALRMTRDVDGILFSGSNLEDDVFWDAIEKTNSDLKQTGLYITHLFMDHQLILSENWYEERVDCELSFEKLRGNETQNRGFHPNKDDESRRPR